jgi:putative addiction module CopG family antidote
MNVRFGKELEDYVKAQVEAGGFTDVSEFIGHCVREYRNAELSQAFPDLKAKLAEGLRSKSYRANPKTLAADMQRRHRAGLRKAA